MQTHIEAESDMHGPPVVITGASSGIGKTCALHLDRLGFRVFAGVRKAADGEALCQQASARLAPIALDITDSESIRGAVDTVATAIGETGLAALINNAGIAIDGPLEFLPIDELRQQFEVNIIGQVAVTQAFLPRLRQGNGRIINMGSITGRLALPFMGAYCASKFALVGLTHALRMELRAWGIPVVLIEPGSIATPVWAKAKATANDIMQRFPPHAHELYDAALAAHHRALEQAGANGISTQVVAETVADALTAATPKARYLVGRDARVMALFAKLGRDRARDRVIVRRMKLPRPTPNGSFPAINRLVSYSQRKSADKGAVFITGASSGIGEACALLLDSLGFRVFASVLYAAEAEALQQKASDRLSTTVLNITDAAAVAAAAKSVSTVVGEAGLVGLVNNAGIATLAPLEFIPLSTLRHQLEVNVLGQIIVTQAFLPLIRQGRGRLVYTGSATGKLALPFLGAYSASKFALEALIDALRVELRPWGISVSLLEPGRVKTSLWTTSTEALQQVMHALPPRAHELYGTATDAVVNTAQREFTNGVPPMVVAQSVVHALTATRPKTRYVVGRDAKVELALTKFMPEFMLDRIILRRMDLPSKA